MNTHIKNVKKEIFTSKEHYLAFRQAWKDYINSGQAKPSRVDAGYGGGYQKISNLTSAHHLLFCLLTEKDIAITFKPSSNESKQGFDNADFWLSRMYNDTGRVIKYDAGEANIPSWMTIQKYETITEEKRSNIKKFFEPFGSTITLNMLCRLFDEFVGPAKLTNKVPEIKEAA